MINVYINEYHKNICPSVLLVLDDFQIFSEINIITNQPNSWTLEYDCILDEDRKGKPFFVFGLSIPNSMRDNHKELNIVWIPFQEFINGKTWEELHTEEYWNKFKKTNLKIISLSNRLEYIWDKIEFPYYKTQFYFNPNNFDNVDLHNKKILFYWNRINLYNSKFVKQICDTFEVEKILIKEGTDGHDPILQKDFDNTEVEYLFHWLPREEYFDSISESNIHLCSRMYEGIGVTALEQLARGAFTLGCNHQTLNEYITHKNSGYLFDSIEVGQEIDTSVDIHKCSNNAILSFKLGYKKWISDIPKILNFAKK